VTLAWLPFPPAELPEVPAGLRVEHAPPGEEPPWLAEVTFYVPPYLFPDVDPGLFARMPRLEVVQTLTAGIEHVAPHVPAGVTLCNGRGIHETSTAELALTLTLASLRGVPAFVRAQQEHRWAWGWHESLADKRVLVLGHGAIGRAIEARLAPFECEVVRVASRARPGVHAVDDLPTLLPEVDVVIVIVPAAPSTYRLVDAAFLAAMKPGALLVNVARGSVVDTDALVEALHAGRVRAALDVTDPEPLPPNHRLWHAPGLLLSPHTGGSSSAMWPRARRVVADQLRRYAAGAPLDNIVEP
jgi:phosphoglycerate dehydrogenase-like enzyme